MPGRKGRSRTQIDAARLQIAKLAIEGRPQEEIGAAVGLSRSYVSRELSRVRAIWHEELVASISEHKARELARINRLEQICWEMLAASRTESQESMAERIDGMTDRRGRPMGEKRKSMLKKASRDGNAGFANIILRCSERRSKLLGLDEPVKVRHGGDKDAPPIQVEPAADSKNPYESYTAAQLDLCALYLRLFEGLADKHACAVETFPALRPLFVELQVVFSEPWECRLTMDERAARYAQAQAALSPPEQMSPGP